MSTDSLGLPEPIQAIPRHETPAYRLAEHSADYLSDTELLSLILKGMMSTEQSIDVARQLLAAHGSTQRLMQLSLTQLQHVPGIGLSAACAIKGALALADRLHRPDQTTRVSLTTPRDVVQYLYGAFLSREQEEFHVLLLDTKHRLLKDEVVTIGLVDRTQIHPREVFRSAIRESCSRIILAHGHPSGDPTPSSHDVDCTRQLVSAGKIIGIDILDHVVIGRRSSERAREYVSFREENLLNDT